MTHASDPFTILRTLDPAPASADPHSPRARADLARILASEPDPERARRQQRPPTRVPRLAAAAAVVAVGTGLALVPWSPGGDAAYATWTAAPTALDAGEAAASAKACRKSQADGAGASSAQRLADAGTAIAERRGAWTLVLLTDQRGLAAMCVTDESRPVFRSSFGYLATEAARSDGTSPVSANVLGVGVVDGNALSLASGPADRDVTAVTYTSPEHGEVSATVSGGHFAFWLPGDELEGAPADGVAVEVEHADGTTETATLRLS